jgi:hypothetical protein
LKLLLPFFYIASIKTVRSVRQRIAKMGAATAKPARPAMNAEKMGATTPNQLAQANCKNNTA